MASHNDLGKEGETIALNYLFSKNYKILEKNWRYKKAEIDLIVLKENTLSFIEVKTRASNYIKQPEEAVSIKKQRLIIQAANHYMSIQNPENELDIQFDIVAIVKSENNLEINHIEEAFYPLL